MTIVDELRLGARLMVQQAGGQLLARRGDALARLDHRPWKTDPYPIYAGLRARGPYTRSATGLWVASTHRVCNEILRDRRWGVSYGPPPGHVPEEAAAEVAAEAEGGGDGSVQLDLSFLSMDPPDHTRLRRLARPAFSPRMIRGYGDGVQAVADRLLDKIERRGPGHGFDLMADFAAPLPIAVISDLLGIPGADSAAFFRYGQAIGQALDGVRSLGQARRLRAASGDIFAIFRELIALRRREPGEDVVSLLVAALDEDELTERELLATCQLLLIAGFETTVNLIGNAVLALQAEPERWKRLTAEPELADAVAEETLRYDPPVQMTSRVAQADMELPGGIEVRRGNTAIVLIGSAGRDPEAHEAPDEFRMDRVQVTDHLAFSGGIHYCLGAPLARLEASVALTALARRLPGLRLTGTPRRRPTTTIRGVSSLPATA